MSTETPLMVYLRHSPRKELAAELCIKDGNEYQLIGVSDKALFNMAKEAITILTARNQTKERNENDGLIQDAGRADTGYSKASTSTE
jgi:hypothetical protein